VAERIRKFFLIFISFYTAMSCITCATAVRFEVKNPPLVDLRGVRTITVIPLEWQNIRYLDYGSDVTQALLAGLKRAKRYTVVDPYKLGRIDRSQYRNYVDVFLIGTITNVATESSTETVKEKDGDKTVEKRITTVKATVSIQYSYFNAANETILGTFTKTEVNSIVSDRTGRRTREQPRIAGTIRTGRRYNRVVRSAIEKFSYTMNNELVPWTNFEKRKLIMEKKNGDQYMIEAQKLVKKGNRPDALIIYRRTYAQTDNINAGYNAALLLEAGGHFVEALAILKELEGKANTSNFKSPLLIKTEIVRVWNLIEKEMILEGY